MLAVIYQSFDSPLNGPGRLRNFAQSKKAITLCIYIHRPLRFKMLNDLVRPYINRVTLPCPTIAHSHSWHSRGGVLLLKCVKSTLGLPSDQAEALVLLHGLSEAAAQDLFGLVAGHVQQVVACVGHGQVVLLCCGRLDDDAQALHAVDGNAVTTGQEHCRQKGDIQNRGKTKLGKLSETCLCSCADTSLMFLDVINKSGLCLSRQFLTCREYCSDFHILAKSHSWLQWKQHACFFTLQRNACLTEKPAHRTLWALNTL